MSDDGSKRAWLPPRWFVRTFWSVHRFLYRVTGGRVGLRRAKANRYGMMRLTTTGRRTGQERSVILGYFDDGPNVVTMAMNGWADGEPAWWPQGEERSRLWARWRELDTNLDAYAALRPAETAVVVLEPSSDAGG